MNGGNGETRQKWDDLDYRIVPGVRPQYEWLQCQVGRVTLEKRVAKYPPQPVFELLGFGRTMVEAEQVAEKRLGR
jgi:hypothetical protein